MISTIFKLKAVMPFFVRKKTKYLDYNYKSKFFKVSIRESKLYTYLFFSYIEHP